MPDPPAAESRVAGEPLAPDLLARMGLLSGFPPAPTGFQPDGGWVHNYRIVACQGYLDRGNRNIGFLQLERIAGGQKTFTLRLLQKILQDAGSQHILQGDVHCEKDACASLLGWRLTSSFADLDGNALAGLGAKESGSVAAGVLTAMSGAQVVKQDLVRPLAADWCLLEAVQRLPFQPVLARPFDVLEGLRLLRDEHRLVYRGRYVWSGKPSPLHWFHQIGFGLLPQEYWLDERHRLLVAATGSRAYILDDEAEAAYEQSRKELQERARKPATR
jgi:hypothetical protein